MHSRVGRRLVAANIRTHGRGGRRSKNAAAAVVWTRALRTIAIGCSDQFTRALLQNGPQKKASTTIHVFYGLACFLGGVELELQGL